MATVTIGAVIPPKRKAKIMHGLLVRGRDRARVRKLFDTLTRVMERDGRVTLVDDPGVFKGQLILDDKASRGLSVAAGKLYARLVDLLEKRV